MILRNSMLEIEKLAKMSRDLAKVNQELEESRLMAVSDQARTATRLLLVSGQLEHTEQKLYTLTKELDDGQKDADLLRIERIKRAALQESEDASRLKIEALQDELQEVQHSERVLQQKLIMIQSKYETLGKRHDNLKRQQQELELARESKEALAWLKETTDRLCSPPMGSMGGHMHSRSSHGSAPISIHQHSPSSSSPPYPSSFIDPPLAAQNQLISLIKELATTNSTLRSELNEYRDLLKDSQNEVLTLRSQVEDYEQGQALDNCCGRMDDASDSYLTSQSAWSVMDTSLAGLDAASHIGTLGSIQGSPPPYMTTPSHRRHHHHHHHHRHIASGVRGNVFGELESFYSQTIGNNQLRPPGAKKTKQASNSSRRRGSLTPSLADTIPVDQRQVGTSSSFDGIRSSTNMSYALSPLNPTPATFEHDPSSPASHRMSLRMDSGLDTVKSGSELEDDAPPNRRRSGSLDVLDPTTEYEGMPRFGGVSLAAELRLAQEEDSSQAALLPPANLEDTKHNDDNSSGDETVSTTTAERTAAGTLSMDTLPTVNRPNSLKNRTSSISLLSAELQKATRSDSRIDLSNDGQPALMHQEAALRRLEGLPDDDALDKAKGELWSDRKPFQQHEKSFSDQGLPTWRQRRRLSEPLHFIAQQNSMTTKKSRPGSIYSIRRARPHMESPDVHCIHSGHYSSASLGGLPDLQRCKSAELVEQIMTERRNRVLEAWRVGVVAAAVTQQQSIHSIVAFGEQRKDSDNISVRSKMSKMSRMSRTSRMSKKRRHGHRRQEHGGRSSGDQDSDTKGVDLAGGVSTAAAMIEEHAGSTDLLATTTDIVKEETDEELGNGNESNTALTIDTAVADSDAQDTQSTPTAARRGPRTPKGKKRQSLLSPKSSRSSLPRSPMARLSMVSNRRFPSEASTASEAMSNRRHDQEHTPYQLLHTLSTELLERLARSDTREMNRRLKRTFDIQALSQMSNSVIENVLTDVSNLGERFRWVEAQAMDDVFEGNDGWNKAPNKDKRGSDDDSDSGSDSDGSEEADWDFSVEEFFPLANMVQEMLSEIGKLRMTINELQLSYVLKVEQDRIRAEKDFMDAYGSDADDAMYEGDDDLGPLERVERAPEKSSAQLKNVLGKLERPNILGTASTGVSGFFNKVFGGSNNNNSINNSSNLTQQEEVRGAPESKDKPTMSKSKSGVVAETSHVFADTAWISSPGIVESKTPKAPVRSATQGTSSTNMSGLLLPGPKLSATTSLAAMATKSPMRSNTVPVPEKLDPANPIATRARAMDISFSPSTSHARSPPVSPSAASPVQGRGLFSRSLPKNQFFGTFSAAVSKADTTTTTHQVSSSAISRSSHSSSVVESLEGIHKVPSTPGPGSGAKPPRSIGISTRVSGPALNVVTKQDVFPEQWTTSTSSSLSASLSTVPSTANSDRRVHASGDGLVPRKPSRAASSSSASVASSSTGAEVSTQQSLKPASKPTLITRASLTVATPSASTVSSPMSATSWFDSKGNSGFATAEGGASTMTGPEGQGLHASGSTSKGLETPTTTTTTTITKGKSLTSFHSVAAAGGSNESLTRSLGRSSGQSALAFLRREPTSVLGSIFQGQNQSTPALVSSGLHTTLKSNLKGKAVLDGPGDYAKPGLEVLDQEYDDFEAREEAIEEALSDAAGYQSFSRPGLTTSRSDVTLPAPSTSLSQRAAVSSTAVAYVVAVPAHTDEKEQGKKKPVFDRGLIKASQKRILAGVSAHQENKPDGFVPVAGPRRARALSVDSMQSHHEPLKQNEIMDLWRVGAGVSRDIWNGIIKKVDGGRS
ncbi:hypothetical protein BGZ59_005471 [Podila verticillata]|nr:hypothetical protein BGZ59_005471 [Podila verticillata]